MRGCRCLHAFATPRLPMQGSAMEKAEAVGPAGVAGQQADSGGGAGAVQPILTLLGHPPPLSCLDVHPSRGAVPD